MGVRISRPALSSWLEAMALPSLSGDLWHLDGPIPRTQCMGLFLHLFSIYCLVLLAPQSYVSRGSLLHQILSLLLHISQESANKNSENLNAGSCLN